MVRGAGCREINLRIRRTEKNVLDIPSYRAGVSTQNPAPPLPQGTTSRTRASHPLTVSCANPVRLPWTRASDASLNAYPQVVWKMAAMFDEGKFGKEVVEFRKGGWG